MNLCDDCIRDQLCAAGKITMSAFDLDLDEETHKYVVRCMYYEKVKK